MSVEGMFYNEDKNELLDEINDYFGKIKLNKNEKKCLGVVVPHAGYVYSGNCAAFAYKLLSEQDFERAILIGPSHQSVNFDFSIGNYKSYQTPFGEIDVDIESTNKLLLKPHFSFIPQIHEREHSLEVQLPFLKIIKPKCKIIPILIGRQDKRKSQYLAESIIDIFDGNFDKTIIIASSDLSHYHPNKVSNKMDQQLIASFKNIDSDKFLNDIYSHTTEACGFAGILTLLNIAKKLNISSAELLEYYNSGDISGDYTQVVGYMSGVIYKEDNLC